MRIAVIGAGSWGTALSCLLAERHEVVRLWGHNAQRVRQMQQTRENTLYLPNVRLPESVLVTDSLQEAIEGAEIVVTVVPSHACRHVFTEMRPWLKPRMILVSATKGIEIQTQMCMSQVMRDVLREEFEPRYVALSGPSFAIEVAQRHPTAVVAASVHSEYAQLIQQAFSTPSFRVYSSTDVIGVELGGAVKNVMALAAGVVAGLGWGYNSTVALATRGLAEMTRLALALGGRAETLAGLAGMGDLMLTCMGALSRNRRVGVELGRGRSLEQILPTMTMVAEGINTTRATYELSRRLDIPMPITTSMYQVLYQGKPPRQAAEELMVRPLTREH
ncbi:MAG: NAD(P)H-dependent glycerol-3-phosphate dehydrogenase [Acidobacteriota bacterium]|nr:NAD(P)-dependent glycerol-3-phosphate dehydrogenase [Blastocatellia bacterium]MDW8238239.1 NAD(P)H-dependent glycerol-3-phosphate dehydrogenase [Acidobacteriota bacterium]